VNSQADLSYSYWAANGPQTSAPPAKRLTGEEAAAAAAEEAARAAGASSAWNAGGTFEERDVSAWARAEGEQLLISIGAGAGGRVAVTKAAVTGEATQWIVRGKARAGFELALVLEWAVAGADAADAGATVTGRATVPEAGADELDELRLEGVEVDAGAGVGAAAAARAAVGEELLPAVEAALRALLEGIREGRFRGA
jgi:hypothetical protein